MNTNCFTGFDHILDNDELTAVFEDFIDSLPHGSGIDCEWSGHMPDNGRYVYFSNSYHCMNEWGMYDGWQDFSIVIPAITFFQFVRYATNVNTYGIAKSLMEVISWEFELQFNNGQHLADKHMLRGYLEDTLTCALYDHANSLTD